MRPITILRVTLSLNLVLTIAAMTLAYRALHHADDSERLVIRSHETLQTAEETLRRVVDVETWERGFVLTHDEADRAAFDRALRLAGAPMEALTAMLRDDGRQVLAERLRAEVTAAITALDALVEREVAGHGIDAPARAAARAQMEAVRTTIRGIRQTETDVLGARLREDASAGRWVNWLALVMTGLATALTTTLGAALLFLARPGFWRGR